jgi:hypothetical protein
MQYLLEEVGSERRFKTTPARCVLVRIHVFVRAARPRYFTRISVLSATTSLLILHAKFREAVSIPRHHTVQSQLLQR